MDCCQCEGIELYFDEEHVKKSLDDYRREGPGEITQILIDALLAEGVEGKSLLDIGGGVGALQHALLKAGIKKAVSVDTSREYREVARREIEKQCHANRIEQHYGNFVELAAKIPEADIVTLDKVICCFDDMEALVNLSSAHSRQIIGMVYPRDYWWTKFLLIFENFSYWIKRSPFRAFVHPTKAVDALLRTNGLKEIFHFQDMYWQVAVYRR